jgi:uncharacterized membrane protein YphA (DoxX/SURF4 family)
MSVSADVGPATRADTARRSAARVAADNRSDARMHHPARWLAMLRIVVGLWFLKGIITKLTVVLVGGVLPVPAASQRWVETMPRLLTRYAAENPFDWFKAFVEGTVIPNAPLWANLTALGETAVGLGLTLGLWTVLASAVGLLLAANYGLATQHMSPGQQGFHLVLVACMLAFLLARAGREWGLDGWLRRRHPGSWLARLPLG